MTEEEKIENKIKNKTILEKRSGDIDRENGLLTIKNHNTANSKDMVATNKAAASLTDSIEHYLKTPIFYYDLKNDKNIRECIINKPENLDKKIESLMRNPNKIKDILSSKTDPSNDYRKNVVFPSNIEEKKLKGHNIYELYKIQKPTFQTLINHEYFTRDEPVEDSFNWIDYGILTTNIFNIKSNGEIEMPNNFLELLESNQINHALHYPSTNEDEKNVQKEDIDFLIELSGGLKNIMETMFPFLQVGDNKKLINEVGEKLHDYMNHTRKAGSIKKSINKLDNDTSGYLLKSNFTMDEFNYLLNHLEKINKECGIGIFDNRTYREIYLNMCIYLKQQTIDAHANIFFDEKVLSRIDAYCRVVSNPNFFKQGVKQLKNEKVFLVKKQELEKGFNKNIIDNRIKEIGEVLDQKSYTVNNKENVNEPKRVEQELTEKAIKEKELQQAIFERETKAAKERKTNQKVVEQELIEKAKKEIGLQKVWEEYKKTNEENQAKFVLMNPELTKKEIDITALNNSNINSTRNLSQEEMAKIKKHIIDTLINETLFPISSIKYNNKEDDLYIDLDNISVGYDEKSKKIINQLITKNFLWKIYDVKRDLRAYNNMKYIESDAYLLKKEMTSKNGSYTIFKDHLDKLLKFNNYTSFEKIYELCIILHDINKNHIAIQKQEYDSVKEVYDPTKIEQARTEALSRLNELKQNEYEHKKNSNDEKNINNNISSIKSDELVRMLNEQDNNENQKKIKEKNNKNEN